MTKDQELVMRDRLTKRRVEVLTELETITAALRNLKHLGRYRPDVKLRKCPLCDAGPFSAREMRGHKCGKSRPVRG